MLVATAAIGGAWLTLVLESWTRFGALVLRRSLRQEEERRKQEAGVEQRRVTAARLATARTAYRNDLTTLAVRTGLPLANIQAMVEVGLSAERDLELCVEQLKAVDARFAANGYRLRIATWQDAERATMAWMRIHGWPDARLTPPGPDGGIDVEANGCVSQVKWHAKTSIPLAWVQQLAGAAAGRTALFFAQQQGTRAPYSKAATAWADSHGACYTLDASGQVCSWPPSTAHEHS